MALDIFIPYWGDPDFMRQAVDSVLGQDSDDWLLTVVDDAYPGNEVRRYLEEINDPRIRYIRKETNQGITENFRTCVSLATQDALVVMGCDDVLLPNFVDVTLRAHRDFPNAWIIQPGVEVINETGESTRPIVDLVKQHVVKPHGSKSRVLSGEKLAVSLLHGDWLYWPSLVFRRDKIHDFDFRDGLHVIQDLGLIIDMVLAGAELLIEPEVCFAYRRHTGSASASKLLDGSRFAGERGYFELAAELCMNKGWRKASRAAKLRLTSRAHAFLLLPAAAQHGSPAAVRSLLRHTLGR
ncbi:glycosyltransferase [Arthrobacter sp. MA-N2]|uniref:glycosyltransferase n=1 Tax=Arthrobacter sp. MA-N2 TaxID=1101188 RepID=UPI00047F3140|nr:glycosyltransferase [Arthrobacter sp. MA-N2]